MDNPIQKYFFNSKQYFLNFLALQYINCNFLEMCERNAKVALDEGEGEVSHAWGLAALAARSLEAKPVDHLMSSEESMGWAGHPLCCNLVQAL